MKRLWLGIAAAVCVGSALAVAQGATTPFKLGTFERQGKPFLGIVLRESVVIDFAAAHAAPAMPASKIAAPADMRDLISRYDQGLRARIGEIIRSVESAGTAARPPYVSDLSALKILPPIIPATMVNVAVNYAEHDLEMAKIREGAPGQATPTAGGALPGTKSAPGIWERTENDPRWNPYMFLKAPAAIIAHGEAIRLPPGRTQVEWECELGLVIGRTASHVPTASATDYIFGYTLQNDVSDRGGRGDTRYGSDWFVLKNHDTFAPLGPFITPKEFVPNVQKLPIRFSLNGKVLQEGTTAQMIHSVVEQVTYATNILTLRTGDIIATGTLPGAGSARTPPIFFKPGDRSECTYEGVGTLINPVVGSQGAGAQ